MTRNTLVPYPPLSVDAGFPARVAWLSQFDGSVGGKAVPPASALEAWLQQSGHLQIDTISVVERAHHHVLWSRDHRYTPALLEELESRDRNIFEYWAHAAAYLPLEDYRYCLPRMRRIAASGHEWFPTDDAVVDKVRQRIRDEGPLRSQDFESEGRRGPWWDWKPAKAALEFLFMSGELMVASRPGFQKVYDLTERVLPSMVDTTYPSDAEMAAWYVERASRALGCFRRRDLAYQRKDGLSGIPAELAERLADGRLLQLAVEGRSETDWYAAPQAVELAGSRQPDHKMHLLSPFDNLIIDRRRTVAIFGYDYTLECYVPAAKRRFGYFSLPLFYAGRPVGSIDCKADRKRAVLELRGCSRVLPGSGPQTSRQQNGRGGAHGALAGALSGTQSVGDVAACSYAELRSALPEAAVAALDEEIAAFAAFNGCAAVSCGS